MATIRLRRSDKQMFLDDADVCLLDGYRLYFDRPEGYAYGCKGQGIPIKIHRLLVGPLAADHLVIDHIDGDKLNNHRSNLRIVTEHENQINRHVLNKNNTSGARGVYLKRVSKRKNRERWGAHLCLHFKKVHIGYFDTKEEAITARKDAEMRYYGQSCPDVQETA